MENKNLNEKRTQEYLHNNKKMVLVQIGRTFYALKEWERIKDASQLCVLLDKFDVRLLKDGEN
jgi:hypothetical protein